MKHAIIIAALWLMASQNAYAQTTNKSDEFLQKEATTNALKRAPGAANINTADKMSASKLLAKAEAPTSTKTPGSIESPVITTTGSPAPAKTQNFVAQSPSKTGSLNQRLQSMKTHTQTVQTATQVLQANTRALLANTDAVRANSEALAANVRAMQANRHLRGEHAVELAAANRMIVPAPSANNMRQPAPVPAPSKTIERPAASASALVKAPVQPAPAPVAAAPAKAPVPMPTVAKIERPQPSVPAAPVKAPAVLPAPAPAKEVAKAPAPVAAPAVAAAPVVTKPQAPAAPAPVAAAPASASSKLPAPMPMAAVKAPAASPVLMAAAPAKMPNKVTGMREKMEISWNGGKAALPMPKPTASVPAPAPAPKVKGTGGTTAVKNSVKSMPLDNLMMALNKAATTRTTMRKKGLMPGDMVTIHGFLRVVSTEDSATEKETYVLQLTSGSQQNDTCFIVRISADELADDNVKETASHAKLFIRQLVKGRVPCIGGHIMRKPVFVTVTGELKYNTETAAAMKAKDPSYQGKRNLHSYTAWEMGQLNNIEFMTL